MLLQGGLVILVPSNLKPKFVHCSFRKLSVRVCNSLKSLWSVTLPP